MRVFAVSDLHVDHDVNLSWVEGLSTFDFQDDVLILAGDISDSLPLLERCLDALARRFMKVLFVPGNHDLWVARDRPGQTSLQKWLDVKAVAADCGVSTETFRRGRLTIVPLLSWYDFSFGLPSDALIRMWADFRACRWPPGWHARDITDSFLDMNPTVLPQADETVISFSHFLPRIDVMPSGLPAAVSMLYPVFGTQALEQQIRRLGSSVHVYGHSHLNRSVRLDGTQYVNNAFAYPREIRIAAKALLCIHETV